MKKICFLLTLFLCVLITCCNKIYLTVENSSLSHIEDGDADYIVLTHLIHTNGNRDEIVITIVKEPEHGNAYILDIDDEGIKAFYYSDKDYYGDDSFEFQVSLGKLTVKATISVTVTARNDPPVALSALLTTLVDTPITYDLENLVDDIDSDNLTYLITTPPEHGVITLNNSTFTYTPNPGYVGEDTFLYGVDDGDDGFCTNFITITVTAGESG